MPGEASSEAVTSGASYDYRRRYLYFIKIIFIIFNINLLKIKSSTENALYRWLLKLKKQFLPALENVPCAWS